MPTIRPLDDPRERAHGGVVVSHTLHPDQLGVVLDRCQLLLPSVGVEYASNVPVFGEAALIGGERTLRELPSHGFRIYDRDIWSGDIRSAPREVCHLASPPPQMLGGESCAARAAERLAPYGTSAVEKGLAFWNVPRLAGAPCDVAAEVPRLQRLMFEDAAKFDLAGAAAGNWEEAYNQSTNPVVRGVLRECGPIRNAGACVARELAKRRIDPSQVVGDIAWYLADPAARKTCSPATPEDVANYYSEAAATLGFVGQEGYRPFIYGASPQDPAAVAAGDHRLVPAFNRAEGEALRQLQAHTLQTVRDLLRPEACRDPSADQGLLDAAPTVLALGGEAAYAAALDLRRRLDLATDRCRQKAALDLIATGDEAAFAAALDPAALAARQLTAPKVFERVRRTFREPPAGYYEGKSYWFVPARLFDTVYLPKAAPLDDEARACGLRPRPLAPGETLQDAINADAGLYVGRPDDRLIVEFGVGGEPHASLLLSGTDYNRLRNDLFRLRDLGVGVSAVGCRRESCGPAELAEMLPGTRVYSSWDELRAQMFTPENLARAARLVDQRNADSLRNIKMEVGESAAELAKRIAWISGGTFDRWEIEDLIAPVVARASDEAGLRAGITDALLPQAREHTASALQLFARESGSPQKLNKWAVSPPNRRALEALSGLRAASDFVSDAVVPTSYPVAVREYSYRGDDLTREIVNYEGLESRYGRIRPGEAQDGVIADLYKTVLGSAPQWWNSP